jgi:hypothetical protein
MKGRVLYPIFFDVVLLPVRMLPVRMKIADRPCVPQKQRHGYFLRKEGRKEERYAINEGKI